MITLVNGNGDYILTIFVRSFTFVSSAPLLFTPDGPKVALRHHRMLLDHHPSSQHPLDKVNGTVDPAQSPSATLREHVFEKWPKKKPATKTVDRSTWKTLRDIVDQSVTV